MEGSRLPRINNSGTVSLCVLTRCHADPPPNPRLQRARMRSPLSRKALGSSNETSVLGK